MVKFSNNGNQAPVSNFVTGVLFFRNVQIKWWLPHPRPRLQRPSCPIAILIFYSLVDSQLTSARLQRVRAWMQNSRYPNKMFKASLSFELNVQKEPVPKPPNALQTRPSSVLLGCVGRSLIGSLAHRLIGPLSHWLIGSSSNWLIGPSSNRPIITSSNRHTISL